MDCDKLAQNIDNCTALSQIGFAELGYIFDVEGMTLTKSGNLVTNMVAVGANKLHTVKINGLQPFTGTVTEAVQQLAAVLFDKTASLIVLGNGVTQSQIINGLTNGRYGMILKQKGVTGQDRYFVMGAEIGMKFDTGRFESYSEANGWQVT